MSDEDDEDEEYEYEEDEEDETYEYSDDDDGVEGGGGESGGAPAASTKRPRADSLENDSGKQIRLLDSKGVDKQIAKHVGEVSVSERGL